MISWCNNCQLKHIKAKNYRLGICHRQIRYLETGFAIIKLLIATALIFANTANSFAKKPAKASYNKAKIQKKQLKNIKKLSPKLKYEAEDLITEEFVSNYLDKDQNSQIEQIDEKEISIVGNYRIDKNSIYSSLSFHNFQTATDKAINDSLETLYATELFADLEIKKNLNSSLVEVIVKENPIVGDIKFVGNKKIEEKILLPELQLKKRSIFSKNKLRSDLARISDIYIKTGRFLATAESKIIIKDGNIIDIEFEIFEGKKAKIIDINFIGNKEFTQNELLSEISTRRSKWYRFFSNADSFDSDRIDFDKEILRRFYGKNGFADFNVISAVSQLTPDKESFFINFALEEGIKYRIKNIKITNLIAKFNEKPLYNKINFKSNEFYNLEKIDKTIAEMTDYMSENSFAFNEIEPEFTRDLANKTIDINFVIKETPAIYIDQIEVKGNIRTFDEVIRRELRISEGDPYNINKINRSRQRIENLGFFETVNFEVKRIGQTNKVDIIIDVKEKKTGEFSFGVGFSTVDKATANIGIKERNFLGSGQEIGLSLQKSNFTSVFDINYQKPYFNRYNLDLGTEVFSNKLNKRNTLAYDQQNQGLNINAGYEVKEFLTHQIRYSYNSLGVANVSDSASQNVKNLAGNFISSTVSNTLLLDKRNNRLDPRSGYFISLSQDVTGFGGNVKNIKHEIGSAYYLPVIGNDFIYKFSLKGGIIKGLGQDVRSNFGFFLGGNNFRGFEFGGIGPRVAVSNDVIGGNKYYIVSNEFRIPLGLPKELGIYGILFNDNGSVTKVDKINYNNGGSQIIDSGNLRSSVGFSIAWGSPMGPIRIDFAKALKYSPTDRLQAFRFNFGTNF